MMKKDKAFNLEELKERLANHCYRHRLTSGCETYVYIVDIFKDEIGRDNEPRFRVLWFTYLPDDESLANYESTMGCFIEYCKPKDFNIDGEWEEVSYECFIKNFREMNNYVERQLDNLYNRKENGNG